MYGRADRPRTQGERTMESTEIRKLTSPLMAKLIAAVRAHADAHYAEGWDPVVEAMTDEELIPVIGYCRTEKGAIAAVAKSLDLHAEVRHDVRAAGGIEEPAPQPVPLADALQPDLTGLSDDELVALVADD